MGKIKQNKADIFIESYLEKIEENPESLKQAIIDFQEEKRNFELSGYLFDYEIAKIYHYDFEDFENGKQFYFEALKSLHHDDKTKGEIYFCLGSLFRDLKEYEESNKYYNLCIDLFSKKNDAHSIQYSQSSLRCLGSNYEDAGDYNKAIEFYKKAHQLSKETDFAGLALYYLSALYHYKFSDYDKALEYSLEAEKVLQEELFQIENYQLISDIYLMKNNFEQSDYYANLALKKFPNYENISDVYECLGRTYCLWRKEEEGISFFKQAEQKLVKDRSDYYLRYISIKSWIAMAYEGKGDLAKALSISSDLLERFSFADHDLILPININGRVLQKMNDFLNGYSILNDGLKEYKTSRFFDKNNSDYIDALEIKNEFYKKLPILNKFFEKFKN